MGGDAWLNDLGRIEDGCDTLFGYKLMKEGFQSITTAKKQDWQPDDVGVERAIFFVDQIIDMVAYPCEASWGNYGTPTGPYLNDRSELQYPDSCNPDDYPEYEPPPCNFDGQVQDKACAGFTNAGCFNGKDNNIDAGAKCGDAAVLKSSNVDWSGCQKDCMSNPECQGFQFSD